MFCFVLCLCVSKIKDHWKKFQFRRVLLTINFRGHRERKKKNFTSFKAIKIFKRHNKVFFEISFFFSFSIILISYRYLRQLVLRKKKKKLNDYFV